MLQFEGKKGVEFCDGLSRRDFLRAEAHSVPGPSDFHWPTSTRRSEKTAGAQEGA